MEIIFLGTGASNGTPGIGKSKRAESSILVKNDLNILIDVTRDFQKQSLNVGKIDAVLLTHGHRDASGGMKYLTPNIPVFAHLKTLETIRNKFKLSSYKLIPVKDDQKIKMDSLTIIPFKIPHSKDSRFPTFAYKLVGGKL